MDEKEILKQILTNQQVIMMNFLDDENIDKILNHEIGKTGEIILDIVKKGNKQQFNSLYGISIKDYIIKEDLKEYLKKNDNDIFQRIELEDSETLKQFYSGFRFALYCIRTKFDLF